MVSLPGPRSPNRSIHNVRSKLRGTRAGSSRSVSVTRPDSPHSASISTLHSSTGRSSSWHKARTVSKEALGSGPRRRPRATCGPRPPTGPTTPRDRCGPATAGRRPGASQDIRHGSRPRRWRRCRPLPVRGVAAGRRGARYDGVVRGLPEPFVTRLVCSDVHAVVDDGHGPPGNRAAPSVSAASRGLHPHTPCSPEALSSLNNRPTRDRTGRRATAQGSPQGGPGSAGPSGRAPAPQAWQVRGRPPLNVTMSTKAATTSMGSPGRAPSALGEGPVQVAGDALGMRQRREGSPGRSAGPPRGG